MYPQGPSTFSPASSQLEACHLVAPKPNTYKEIEMPLDQSDLAKTESEVIWDHVTMAGG